MEDLLPVAVGILLGAILTGFADVAFGALGRDFETRAVCRILSYGLSPGVARASQEDWNLYREKVAHGLDPDELREVASAFEPAASADVKRNAKTILDHHGRPRRLQILNPLRWRYLKRRRAARRRPQTAAKGT